MVEAASEADVPELIALVRATLAEFGFTYGEGSGTDTQVAELPRSYTDHGGAFWVARRDGKLLGCVGLYPLGDGVFELRKMFLDPRARGQGVAQQLFTVLLAFARSVEARTIVLDTAEHMTRAIGFYEKHGFVRDDGQRRAVRCHRGYRLDL